MTDTNETMTETIKRTAAQLATDMMKAALPSRSGRVVNARQMAMMSHWLSADGMTANTADGGVWQWSDCCGLWSCVKGRR